MSHLNNNIVFLTNNIVNIAHKHNKPVSVCGEVAGDPASALALAGMGADSLSMSVGGLPRVKLAIRSFTQQQLENLSTQELAMEKAEDIRLIFNQALEQAGVGRLVRTGK